MVAESPAFMGLVVEPSPILSISERCKPAVYDPLKFPWHSIREAVMTAERANFPERPETEETLFGLFFHPESIVGVVTDPFSAAQALAGFSLVVPTTVEYGLPETEFPHRFKDATDTTAYVHCTQFLDRYQGHGLVAGLNDLMMSEIVKRFDFLERDARTKKGYAYKLLKAYGDHVVESYVHDSIFGEEMFMRISLAKQVFLYD